MMQSTNQISIYKKAGTDLLQKMGFGFDAPLLSYDREETEHRISEADLEDNEILVNKYDTNWTPEEHNLRLKQIFYFKDTSHLFGSDGIVARDNSIGIGVHIYSPKSFFQMTQDFGTINYSDVSTELVFDIDFPAKSLRGVINFSFFIYLKSANDFIRGQAKTIGLRLCEEELHSFSLIVDGDGSDFPILDFTEKDGPLWKIEKNWVDAADDTFDSSNVYIALNTKHYLFDRVKAATTWGSKALMGEIMLQSISMIVNEVINVEGYDPSSEDADPGTILMAVKYWIETFEIQTETIYSITNSLRANQGNALYGG